MGHGPIGGYGGGIINSNHLFAGGSFQGTLGNMSSASPNIPHLPQVKISSKHHNHVMFCENADICSYRMLWIMSFRACMEWGTILIQLFKIWDHRQGGRK